MALLEYFASDSGGREDSKVFISASTSSIIADRVVATLLWSWDIDSPCVDGIRCGL